MSCKELAVSIWLAAWVGALLWWFVAHIVYMSRVIGRRTREQRQHLSLAESSAVYAPYMSAHFWRGADPDPEVAAALRRSRNCLALLLTIVLPGGLVGIPLGIALVRTLPFLACT